METAKRGAVYIDLENLIASKDGAAISISGLMETIQQRFPIQTLFTEKLAVGNNDTTKKFEVELTKYNFEIQNAVKISRIKNGNRADLMISISAIETLLPNPHKMPTDIYVFVTRDSDFSVVMDKLRKYGKQVLLVTDAESAKLDIFKNTTDAILTFGELKGSTVPVEIPDNAGNPIEASAKTTDGLNDSLKSLVNELEKFKKQRKEWVLYTAVLKVNNILYKKDGYTKFSNLVADAEEKNLVEKRVLKKGVDELRLKPKIISKSGVQTTGKIISKGKAFVRIESRDGKFRALPNGFRDKSVAIEKLPLNAQVAFTIQTPCNGEVDGYANDVYFLSTASADKAMPESNTEDGVFAESSDLGIVKCDNCKRKDNCVIRHDSQYDGQFDHPCNEFEEYNNTVMDKI